MRMSSVSLDLVAYDSVFAQRQVQALQGTCTSCRRESYTVKRCTRCGLARYCDRECQRRDYRRHKGICMTISDFEAAKKRIGPDLRQVLLGPAGFTGFSFFIGSLPDITRFNLIGQRLGVIVQIVRVLEMDNPLRQVVVVRDVTNQTTVLEFALDDMLQKLANCFFLHPRQFILLLHAPLRVYSWEDKISEVVIRNMNQAKFIV